MSTDADEQLAEALEHYRRRREETADFQRDLAALSVTAVAPRGVVSITIDGSGEITELKFPGTAYKNLTRTELSTVVTKTIEEAREAALDRAAELLAPMLPPGVDAGLVVRGKANTDVFTAGAPEA